MCMRSKLDVEVAIALKLFQFLYKSFRSCFHSTYQCCSIALAMALVCAPHSKFLSSISLLICFPHSTPLSSPLAAPCLHSFRTISSLSANVIQFLLFALHNFTFLISPCYSPSSKIVDIFPLLSSPVHFLSTQHSLLLSPSLAHFFLSHNYFLQIFLFPSHLRSPSANHERRDSRASM